ncbi:TetR family transcriptional regulator C-terminal domain-containing protein [Nocardia goodfellowii]|uniref:Tetracyclin repressor-like C-terminal domain-containing protein n=1 Tax=Nocardia goodfellowii TaxID=882446 RepID=A0ABS4QEM8_9NOCA|nr:hypothetical protein [Nocardia goodfellowii]MBP2190142.1 hypothetical protein [Nocardia goodfellowii]
MPIELTPLSEMPGTVRDRLRDIVADWRAVRTAEVAAAQKVSTTADRPCEEIATVVIGISMAVNQEIQLLADRPTRTSGHAVRSPAAAVLTAPTSSPHEKNQARQSSGPPRASC